MIQLYINNQEVELTEDNIFAINKQFTDLSDLTALCTDFTKTINVPRSKHNEELFNHAFNLDRIQTDMDYSKKIEARLEENSNILLEGYVLLNNTKIDVFEITLYGQIGKMFKDFRNIPLSEVVPDFEMNAQYVASSFKSGIIDYEEEPELNWVGFDSPFTIPQDITYMDPFGWEFQQPISIPYKVLGQDPAGNTVFRFELVPTLPGTYRYEVEYYGSNPVRISLGNQPLKSVNFSFKRSQNKQYSINIDYSGPQSSSTFGIIATEPLQTVPFRLTLPAVNYSKVIAGQYEYLPTYENGVFELKSYLKGITGVTGYINLKYQNGIVGFCATHQGQYQDFNSTKSLIGDLNMDMYNNQFDGLTEHSIREYRSYYQQPYLYLRPLFKTLQGIINTEFNYELIYDPSWFNNANPYWTQLVYMCKNFYDRQDDHQDGKTNDFTLKPGFVGHINKECLPQVPDLKYNHKFEFDVPPQDFNVLGNTTIELLGNHRLLKGNLTPRWFLNIEDAKPKERNSISFVLSIPGGTDAPMFKSDYDKIRLPVYDYFYVTIRSGDLVKKYGFYPVEHDGDNIAANVLQFFTANGVHEYYPLGSATEGYYDGQRGTLIWDLGIRTFGWGSTINTDFEISWHMNNPLGHVYIPTGGTPQSLTYDCVDVVGIPLGDYPVEETEINKLAWEGTVFYSDYDTRRSGSVVKLSQLLAEEDKPIDLLIKYAKMFRLYFDVDYKNRKILLTDRYFDDYEVVDWTNKVDYNSMKVYPIQNNDEFVLWGYQNSDSKYNENYRLRTGTNYGDSRINTGIDTLNNENKLFEDFPISCTSIERYPTYSDASTYNSVFNMETCPVAINNGKNATVSDRVSLYGSFYFICNTQNCEPFSSLAYTPGAGKFGKTTYLVTDDTLDMVLEDEYCWAYKNGNYVENKAYETQLIDGKIERSGGEFPLVDYITQNVDYEGAPQRLWGCIFAKPKFRYTDLEHQTNLEDKEVHYIDELWKDWLDEIYDKNNKKVECQVYLTKEEFSTFKFNKLVQIENNIFLVNKIKDFSGTGLTSVELLQISNTDSLKSQFQHILETGKTRKNENGNI